MAQRNQKDNRPVRGLRTPLLTPTLKAPITAIVPDVLKAENKKDHVYGRFLREARNMARCYGFKLKTKKVDNSAELRELLRELQKKSNEDIQLVQDDKGNLQIYHGVQLSEEYNLYWIPFGTTFKMRPETGELVRRFLNALRTRFRIDTIDELANFEYEIECYECYQDGIKQDGIEEDECCRESHALLLDYRGGKMSAILSQFKKLSTVSRLDILDFKPQDEAEMRLQEIMLRGFDYMDEDFNIWVYRDYDSPVLGQKMRDNCDGMIGVDEIFCFIYDYDEVTGLIEESINNELQCGAWPEQFSCYEPLTEKGNVKLNTEMKTFFTYVNELTTMLNDPALQHFEKPQIKEEHIVGKQAA